MKKRISIQEIKNAVESTIELPDGLDKKTVYSVDSNQDPWIITFYKSATVRVHTSKGYAPYLDLNCDPTNEITLHKNQWCELKYYGGWALMTNADRR